MRPPGSVDRRGVVVAAAGLLALLALGVLGAWGATNALGCGPGERDVLGRFPHYGGRTPEPRSELELGICSVGFVTPDPKGEVFAYYEERLRERGWEVEVREPPKWSSEYATLEATRGGYRYDVVYESDVRMPGGRRVRVIVTG